MQKFAGHIIVGIDAMNGMVATDGWANVTDVKATDLAKRFADAGVSSIVYTDIARDGMMQGVNIEQTVHLAQYSGLPVIASGGVTNMDDVRNLKDQPGILGAITGRAIYEGTLNLREAQLLLDEQEAIIASAEKEVCRPLFYCSIFDLLLLMSTSVSKASSNWRESSSTCSDPDYHHLG